MTPDETDQPVDATASNGERPGQSMRELFHPEENVGATDEEHDRQDANVQAASDEADRIRAEPDHHGREHL